MRYRPWTLDFTPDDNNWPSFPHKHVIDPYAQQPFLEWTPDDWDPALRFWSLEYDPNLTRWLSVVDPSRPSIVAACEFGQLSNHNIWKNAEAKGWLEPNDLKWRPGANTTAARADAFLFIHGEIQQLQQLMQDDRERYLAEIDVQADGLAETFLPFIGAYSSRHPWTVELINCGLAIGNVAYMFYKAQYKRVRPSLLCPGLIPAFGPPRHPSFPSGHSFLGHLIALFLLEIPALQERFGVFGTGSKKGGPVLQKTLDDTKPVDSPLLWLSHRLAKNRERLGVHYPSDSNGSRHLASGLWWAMLHDRTIVCPTLEAVLRHAKAEWP